jgi:hypothetical protein
MDVRTTAESVILTLVYNTKLRAKRDDVRHGDADGDPAVSNLACPREQLHHGHEEKQSDGEHGAKHSRLPLISASKRLRITAGAQRTATPWRYIAAWNVHVGTCQRGTTP